MRKLYKNSLIVSCQALADEPLHGSDIMARLAIAADNGGAKGIRANSPEDVRAIREVVDLPIIGLWKKEVPGFQVYITPTYKEVKEILAVGADFVAIDCTDRKRPQALADIFTRIRTDYPDCGIVADIATVNDAKKVSKLKPDFISTTLSGYTKGTDDRPRPDLELVKDLKEISSIPILAEGNYKDGRQGAQAIKRGAYAVVIGGAITRPQNITKKIREEIAQSL
ncbi:N-acetylmannosamine-6-phosphate 2-epimerase [Natronospora cellulosivora (SeqCode)]